ncbi:PLD nuclease N-terminal domain-containing protein [Candidatus Woesearchaeota archaeon]|nr:PLD nuclease N-terminal domain-containing protein [Candidatus Woesearchaeota archaeon]
MNEAIIFLGILLLILTLIALLIFLFVFWILMLIDCAKRKNWSSENEQLAWILLIVFLGFLGAIMYHFIVKTKKK